MTWGSTRVLEEGKEQGYGAGCGCRGDFPLRRGVMFIEMCRLMDINPDIKIEKAPLLPHFPHFIEMFCLYRLKPSILFPSVNTRGKLKPAIGPVPASNNRQ